MVGHVNFIGSVPRANAPLSLLVVRDASLVVAQFTTHDQESLIHYDSLIASRRAPYNNSVEVRPAKRDAIALQLVRLRL